MNRNFPYINWLTFLETELGGLNLDNNTEVFFERPKFFKAFGHLMENTSMRTIANFFFWRLTDASKSFLSSKYFAPSLEFVGIFGVSQNREGWKRCVTYTRKYFSLALSALLARKKVKSSYENFRSYVKAARQEIRVYINNLNITKIDAENLAKRLDDTTVYVEPPSQFLNDSALDLYYQDLSIEKNQHFKNYLSLEKFTAAKRGFRLLKPTRETLWESYVDDLYETTYYSSGLKLISFSSTELESPNFHTDLPEYINWAGVGTIIMSYFSLAFFEEVRKSLF